MAMKKSILDEIILNIEGNPWTVRDACTGCIVFGVVAVALFGLYLWRRHVKMVRWREAGKPAGRIATWITDLKSRKA